MKSSGQFVSTAVDAERECPDTGQYYWIEMYYDAETSFHFWTCLCGEEHDEFVDDFDDWEDYDD